jgi:hypothetical protein
MITFVREFTSFLVARRNFWLIPVLVMLAVFGGLLVLTKGSVIAPFIYTLF